MINPQEEKIKKIIDMFDSGCTCSYNGENYTKETITLRSCIIFTNPNTQSEETVGHINFKNEDKTISIQIVNDTLLFSDQ